MLSRLALLCLGLAVFAVALFFAVPASARAGGIDAGSCAGCHGNPGTNPQVTIEPSAFDVVMGQTIQLKISVASSAAAGMYVRTIIGATGTYQTVSGQQTSVSGSGNGVVHSSPKGAVNGVTTFLVNWQAPFVEGGVMFMVAALATNGDGDRRGDAPNSAQVSIAVGCMTPSKLFARDFDGDGHGVSGADDLRACTKPQYYAEAGDDCDDNDERNFPGNAELCDTRDNNCSGTADEGLSDVTLYEDVDRDGYGRLGGMSRVGCTGLAGWGVGQDDCDDSNPSIHLGAFETCNGKDDDCDARVDNGVLPDCGLGWCRRLAYSCTGTCTPGPPRAEVCNYFDDDCDGLIDEEENLCAVGQSCQLGVCVQGALPPPPPPPPVLSETGGSGGANSSGGNMSVPSPTMSGGSGTMNNPSRPAATTGGRGAVSSQEPEVTAKGCGLSTKVPHGRELLWSLSFLGVLVLRRRHRR